MTDERFLRGFQSFDAAVAPDPAFAERLYADLADELGFRSGEAAAPAPTAPVASRVRRAFRLDWRPLPPAQMRLVYLAAAAALLTAALAGSAFVASQLLRSHPSPLEIVRQSQATVVDPPPFVLTYRSPASDADLRFSYDGEGTWRADEPEGGYELWDGAREGLYSAQSQTWGIVDVPVTDPPFILLMDMWAWTSVNAPAAVGTPTAVDCADAIWVEEARVADRDAYHVRCPSWDVDYWIDRDSHLVLKFLPGTGTPGWTDATPEGVLRGIEAVWLDLSPPNAAAFSWDGPVGSYPADQPPASTVLAVGAPAPAWAGTTVDGEELVLPAQGRPTAVLFGAIWCGDDCLPSYEVFSRVLPDHPDVGGVVVTNDHAGTAAGYRDLHPMTVPLVADPETAFASAWGMTTFPTLVLFDGDGTVAALRQGRLVPADLEAMLAALTAGDPPPTAVPATPTPAPTGTPTPTPEPHAVMPAWNGHLLGGGTLDSASLRGRPTVVYFAVGLQAQGESPVDEGLVAFGKAVPALEDRANVVMIVSAEWTPGSFAALLQKLEISVPTVLDWDYAVTQAMTDGLQMPLGLSTFVFAADGRLVTTGASFPGEPFVLDALNAAESGTFPPLPTPMP